MHPRLKAFKSRILAGPPDTHPKLYFVKVDVQACFDNIPQENMFKLIEQILDTEEYRVDRYTDVQPPDSNGAAGKRPFTRWKTQAKKYSDPDLFAEYAQDLAKELKRGSVLVDGVRYNNWTRTYLLELLSKHLTNNIVKIGKKHYRQRTGIPQGSVLSTILCTFLYGSLEQTHLPYTTSPNTLLLRMVDDFLLITTDRTHATRFLHTMHVGLPSYGVTISPDKTLTNFTTTVLGRPVRRLLDTHDFPYCGSTINTRTLAVKKDRTRIECTHIGDSLTVDYAHSPGQNLLRKTIRSFKISCAALWLDTAAFNSFPTVLANIYHNFIEVAMKFCGSVKSLRRAGKKVRAVVLRRVVEETLETSYMMMKTRERANESKRFVCVVGREEFMAVGVRAWRRVLQRKQAGYRGVLRWLGEVEGGLKMGGKKGQALRKRLEGEGLGGGRY